MLNLKFYIALFCTLVFLQSKAQQDVGVPSINYPISGCQVGNPSTNINVVVENYSASSVFPNTISVKYTINSGPVHSELIGSFLGPGNTINFTFFKTENFSACGNYQLKIWAVKSGDPNHSNDTLNYLFVNDCNPVPGIITGPSQLCYGVNSDSLTVTGGNFAYTHEWYKKTVPGSFLATGNLTNKIYLNNLIDSTVYYVRYEGGLCPDVNSAIHSVSISPTINTGTISPDLTLCIDNVVGNVSLSGYVKNIVDWQQSNNGGATWNPLGNSTSSVNINYLTNSALFRAVVESGACGTKFSDTVSVVIEPLVIPGTISGASTVCSGFNTINLTLSGHANQTSLEWYSSTDNITFTPTGITTPTFNTFNITQTTYYKVILHGNICSDVETPVITVLVDPAVNTGVVSPNFTVCETNVTGVISISGYTSVLLDWEQSDDNGVTWYSTGNSGNTHDISYLTGTARFRAVIQSGVCPIEYSSNIIVTVQPIVVTGTISGINLACGNSNGDPLTLTGHNNYASLQWYFSNDNLNFNAANVSSAILSTNNITQTTYYYVILNGGICPPDTTSTFVFNIDQYLNLGTPSPDINLCSNNITGAVTITGYSTTIIDWEQSNDGGTTWFSTGDNSVSHDISGLTATAHFRAFISSGTCGSGYSDTIAVNIQPAVIPGSISSGSNLCSGLNSDTLILTGNANDFGFQWYSSLDNITFTPTGITNDTLIVTNLTQTTYYKVILTGIGCPNDETNITTCIVSPPLNLGTTSSDLTLCSSYINGSVSISGYTANLLDWQQSNDGGATWFSTGNNANSHNISYLTASADFRANISSGACGNGFSDTISVIIENSIIPGTINGANSVCSGLNTDTLVLTGNLNDFGYQWYSATLNTSYLPTGITNDTLIVNNLTETTYFKVILNGNVCADAETTIFTVTIDAPLNLGTISPNLALCTSNLNGAITINGYSTTLVDWEQSDDGGFTWYSTGNNSTPYNVSYLIADAHFRALIQSGACGSGYSDTIAVEIENEIIPGIINGDTAVCTGINSDTLVLSGNAFDFGFEWYKATLNTSYVPTGITNDTIIVTDLTQTTYFKVILNGNICNDDETAIFTVTVDPTLNVGTTSPDLILCSSNVIGNVSLSSYTSTIEDWEQSNDGGITWFSTGSSNSTHDISYLTASAHFRALVSSGACGSGYSDTISVIIEDAIIPGTIAASLTVCAGPNSDTLILTGNANDLGFEWYSATLNTSFFPTGVTNDTLIITNLTQTTDYKVILHGNVCPNSETNVISITILPSVNTGTTSPDLALCSSNISGTVSLSGYATTIIDWEQSNDGGATWFSTGVNTDSVNISYLTASADFRAFVQAGFCGSGYSDTISVVIEDAIIPGSISASMTVCAGINTDTLVLNGNANGFGYEWYSATLNTSFVPTGVTNDTLIINNITQNTDYKVIFQGNICPNDETNVITITIAPVINVGTTSPDLALCSSNISGTVSLSGYATTIIDWEQSNDGGVTWFSTGVNTDSVNISYLTASADFRAFVQAGFCGSGYSDTISVVIEDAIIPGSISASMTVCAGNNTDTLVLNGNVNGFGYEWYSATLNTSFVPTGVTNDTLIVNNLTQNTDFKVVFQGNICPNAETNVITISIVPVVNVGIISPDLALCSSNITGNVSLSGYATTIIDWEQSNDGGLTWFSTGVNTDSLNISYLTASADFRAFVQAGFCGSGYSDTISVVIEDVIIPGTISGSLTVCSGNNSDTLVLSGNANGFGYEWYSATLNTSFSPTGVTNDTLILNNITQNTDYKVIFQGNICPNDETSIINILVDLPLDIGIASPDLHLCSDNIIGTISISGFNSTIDDWEQSNDNGVTWFSTGQNINPLDISFLTASADFRAIISSGTCGSSYSDTISVIIETAILPGVISGTGALCAGINADTLVLTGNANQIGFEWYSATLNTSFTPTGITNDTIILSNLTQTTYFKVVLHGNYCSDVETPVYTVQVDPPVQTGLPSADLFLCENNVVGTVSLSGFTSSIVIWEQSNDGGISWLPTTGVTASHDISYLTSSALFRAIVASGACGTQISDTISVDIQTLGTPSSIGFSFSACFGSPDLDSIKVISHSGSINSWQTSTNAGVTWTNIGTGDSILYVNYLSQTALFQLVTSHGACPNVASNSIIANVNPLPTVFAGVDTTMVLGNATLLNGSGGLFGIWTPNTNLSNPNLANPNCYPFQTTTYAYTVIDGNGCTNTDYVTITIIDDTIDYSFMIYNIITPNGDGKNDYFTINGINTISDYKINIFNANGNLIFTSVDYNNDWGATYNGEIVPDGTYLYAVEIDNVTKYRGFLTIMKGID